MDATPVAHPASVKRLRCVIIEDHRMFLDLVTTMLHAAPGLGIDVVETAGTVAGGIGACDRVKPDVVLLDLALPDGTGITVAEHVASTQPDARIVVISGQSSTFVCPTKLARCTHAVVHKAEAFDALQAILAGLSAPDCRPATSASGRQQTTKPSLIVRPLSQREREILALVGASLTSDEIAAKLELSLHTVSTHRKNIAMKLGIPGRKLTAEAYRFREQLARDATPTLS
jgi:DNA-binding NarL/FixJ family response regulator